MEHDWVQTDAVQKAETERKLVQLIQYSATDFNNSKFGGVGGVR